jgi:hypothetical protein
MKKKSNIMIFAAIALTTGAAIAYDQIRPIDYHELGISLVNEPYCESLKLEAVDFAKTVPGGESAYTSAIKKACSESTVKLSDAEHKKEQEELRSLKDSHGKASDNIWEISRDMQGILMRQRRMNIETKAYFKQQEDTRADAAQQSRESCDITQPGCLSKISPMDAKPADTEPSP